MACVSGCEHTPTCSRPRTPLPIGYSDLDMQQLVPSSDKRAIAFASTKPMPIRSRSSAAAACLLRHCHLSKGRPARGKHRSLQRPVAAKCSGEPGFLHRHCTKNIAPQGPLMEKIPLQLKMKKPPRQPCIQGTVLLRLPRGLPQVLARDASVGGGSFWALFGTSLACLQLKSYTFTGATYFANKAEEDHPCPRSGGCLGVAHCARRPDKSVGSHTILDSGSQLLQQLRKRMR